MSNLFYKNRKFNGHIELWDVRNVTDMRSMFFMQINLISRLEIGMLVKLLICHICFIIPTLIGTYLCGMLVMLRI
jgi:hypothetical protein